MIETPVADGTLLASTQNGDAEEVPHNILTDSSGNPINPATAEAVALLGTALASILAKIIAAPATEAKQDTGNTTLASILAKIIAAPATEAKQDTGNTSLASILAKIIAAPATEAKQDTGNASLVTIAGKDFATQTTLAAVLAKIIAAPATEAKQDSQISAVATIGTRAYSDASGQHVAYTGSAAQSNAIVATEVTVVATTDCYVAFGANPTASAGAGSMFLAAGVPFTRRITSGWKVSGIRLTDSGALSVLPVA